MMYGRVEVLSDSFMVSVAAAVAAAAAAARNSNKTVNACAIWLLTCFVFR